MQTKRLFKTTGILVILLGSIHLAATPFIFPVFRKIQYQDLSSLYMFVMVGISTLLTGWLQIFSLERSGNDKGYQKILTLSVTFMVILGTGAVAAMWQNPFAYISLLIAIVQVFILNKKQLYE
jgi:hypothetical protein